VVSAATLTTILTTECAPAAISASLLSTLIGVATSAIAVAPAVLLLAQGATVMTWTKLAVGTAMLSASVLVVGWGIAGPQTPAAKPADKPAPAKAAKSITQAEAREIWDRIKNAPPLDGKDDGEGGRILSLSVIDAPQIFESESEAIIFVQYEAVCREFELRLQQYRVGKGTLDVLLNCAQRRFQSHIKVSKSHDERVHFCDDFVRVMSELYQLQVKRYQSGALTAQDLEQTGYALAEFHLQSLRVKAGNNAPWQVLDAEFGNVPKHYYIPPANQ
jgi:hypothetical protein